MKSCYLHCIIKEIFVHVQCSLKFYYYFKPESTKHESDKKKTPSFIIFNGKFNINLCDKSGDDYCTITLQSLVSGNTAKQWLINEQTWLWLYWLICWLDMTSFNEPDCEKLIMPIKVNSYFKVDHT